MKMRIAKYTKPERRTIMLSRLARALANVYHNATLSFGNWPDECPHLPMDEWAQFHAECEIEYLREFHSYGAGKRRTYRTKSGKARTSRILTWDDPMPGLADWGEVFSYGRGGRTAAPEGWITTHGGTSFRIADAESLAEGLNAESLVELIRCVEGLNAWVTAVCADFPRCYAQAVADATADAADHLENQQVD